MYRPLCLAELEEIVARPRRSFWIDGKWVQVVAYMNTGHVWMRDVVSGAVFVKVVALRQRVATGLPRSDAAAASDGVSASLSVGGAPVAVRWDARRRVASVSLGAFAEGELALLHAPPSFSPRRVRLEHTAVYVHEGETRILLTLRDVSADDAPRPSANAAESDIRDAIVESEPLVSPRYGTVRLAAFENAASPDGFAKLLLRVDDGRVVLVVGRGPLGGERCAMAAALRRAALRRGVRFLARPWSHGSARLYVGGASRKLAAKVIHASGETTWVEAAILALSPGRAVELSPEGGPRQTSLRIRSVELVRASQSPTLRLHVMDDE